MANQTPGQIVDLKHEHLLEMLALRKYTHGIHYRLFPDTFSQIMDEKYLWRELNSYMPNWADFFKRRMRFGIGWQIENTLKAYLLYCDYASPLVSTGEVKWVRLISDIAVEESEQMNGIASALIAEVRDRAAKRNISTLYANVWKGNEASEALFRKAGFDIQTMTYYLPIK